MNHTLAIIVPCFNEEEILRDTHEKLKGKLKQLVENQMVSSRSFLLYVDDGSRDDTWKLLAEFAHKKEAISLKLSTNFGHQNALLAGMLQLKERYDMAITIDADLQDDIEVLNEMVRLYNEGKHIVYGVREDRSADSFFKKTTAQLFYKLMIWLKVRTIYNHADFRLISKTVAEQLENYRETNLFLRGIFPTIGYPTAIVKYSRKERLAGESKYPFRKMLHFAWNGISSFSSYPLRMIFLLGLVVSLLTLGLVGWALIESLRGHVIPGWASIVIPMFFFSGLQMICIGLIGEYLGKIYQEIKARPRYIIEKIEE